MTMVRRALAIVPALESDNDHGTAAQSEAARAASRTTVIAASNARVAEDWGQTWRGMSMPSSSRKPPQPTNAAA